MPRSAVSRNVSQDAVVVIPGIMGSQLVDTTTNKLIWGLDPGWYAQAWLSRAALRRLELTDDEREGRIGCVAARGLLKATAFAPVLAGFEPYTKLVTQITTVVVSRRAVLEFGYDWRLPVRHNARLLVTEARAHLERWRRDEAYTRARVARPEARPAQLVLVAHSMGGLLCRAATADLEDVRTMITLGTPFDGAAKAAVLLNSGRGDPVPLPRRHLRRLAATLPGVHDLLPVYRCVDDGDVVRRLTPADVDDLGGNRELAESAQASHAQLAQARMMGHRAVVGTDQPTVQSITLRQGVIGEQHYSFVPQENGDLELDANHKLIRVDRRGDGTVPRNSANPVGCPAQPVAQQHGVLAKADEAVTFVCAVIRDEDADLGPRLGGGEIGLDIPDVVDPGVEWVARVTGVAPHEAACRVVNVQTGLAVDHPPLHRGDSQVRATVSLPEPGLFRVEVSGGGESAVTQVVMAVDPTAGDPDYTDD